MGQPGDSWLGPAGPPPPPPPETQIAYGFEPGDNAAFNDVRTVNIVDSPVNQGTKAMQAEPTAYRAFHTTTVIGQRTAYRLYANWSAPPASGVAQIAWVTSSSGGTSFTVRVDASGRVSLRDASGTIRGQSAPLAPGAWHRIEFLVTQNPDGTGTGSLRINGTDVASDVSGSFGTGAANRFRVGQMGSAQLPGITHDDVGVGRPGASWLGAAGPPALFSQGF